MSITILACLAAAPQALSAQGRIISPDSAMSIVLPNSFNAAVLNADAQLQFADTTTESYVMVLREGKEDLVGWNLTRHSMITLAQFLVGIDNPEVTGPVAMTIGGHPAVQYLLVGAAQGTRIAYLHTTIESPANFAQVVTWTAASRWAANEALMRTVAASVELPTPNASVLSDPHFIVPGTWAWLSNENGCDGLKQRFVISPDRKTMQIHHSEPIEKGDGTMVSVTSYAIESASDLTLHTYITDETRLTDDGDPVKWDLVTIGRNRLTWHRADWPEGAYTGMLQRCSQP